MTQADWGSFFVAQTGASAALIGLLFVALSINLQRIIVAAFLVDRVAETVLVIGGLLMFSIFGTVPRQSVATFGVELFAGGSVVWVVTTALMIRSLRNRPPQVPIRYAILRVVLMQAATLFTVVAGALLTTGHNAGFFWLVPATLISYIAGIGNAWALTVEILR
jgi:modulator of FtsH protease